MDAGDGAPAASAARDDRSGQGGARDCRDDHVANRQVDPPWSDIERSAHEAEPPPPPLPLAVRRDSSSTTVFWG